MLSTRRDLLREFALMSLAFTGLQACATRSGSPSFESPELIPDPAKILDLPLGFSYEALSQTGEAMHDGLRVPARHGGMGAFTGPDGRVILIRNHELDLEPMDQSGFAETGIGLAGVEFSQLYDGGYGKTPSLGGATTLIYNPRRRRVEKQFMSLAGTSSNCAGGVTPWNSWISCERSVVRAGGPREKDHGYCFEVPRSIKTGLVDPVPLRAMGRFKHYAVASDPSTGIVYLTEDRPDGLFYRFLPDQPGKLLLGGQLQALRIREAGWTDTRNWEGMDFRVGERIDVEWVDLEDIDSPDDDLRYRASEELHAARFARGQGIWYGVAEVYFCCLTGGPTKNGQIWRYTLSHLEGKNGEWRRPGGLELFAEFRSPEPLRRPSHITTTPWGDLIVCEDGAGADRLIGIDGQGRAYTFARNAMNNSEFAGATFSPDGQTVFVNVRDPGVTFAITGPWPRARKMRFLQGLF
jgi:secreted PhoX family phosphatase